MTDIDIQDDNKAKFGGLKGNYSKDKKASSFLSNLNINTEEPNALLNLVRELAEVNENLPMKARLSKNQIITFAKGYWYAMRYKVQTLVDYCDMQLVLTVSESGKGREELTQLSNAIAREQEVKAKANEIKL